MSDGIMLSIGEDGIAREYDDTYDITIHCKSREEQEDVFKVLSAKRKVGVWRKESRADIYKFQCSECGCYHRAMYDFCPSCGAEMIGGGKE